MLLTNCFVINWLENSPLPKLLPLFPGLSSYLRLLKSQQWKCEEDFPNISLNWFFVSVKKIFLWKQSPHMVVGLSASSYPSPPARTVVEKTRLSYLFWSTKFWEIYIISSYNAILHSVHRYHGGLRDSWFLFVFPRCQEYQYLTN